YEECKEAKVSEKTEEYVYAYRLKGDFSSADLKEHLKKLKFSADAVEDKYFKEYWDRTAGNKDILLDVLGAVMPNAKKRVEKMFGDSTANLKLFLEAEENARIDAAADDVEINQTAGTFVGILLVILCSYVISVFVVHNIDKESSVIGALYSMGVKRRELLFCYILLPVIITFVSGGVGLLLSCTSIGIAMQMQDSYNYFSMPVMQTEITPFMVVYAIAMPPVAAAAVNILVIRRRLSRTPLSLLKNEQRLSKVRNVRLRKMPFLRLFKLRQLLREMRTGFAVIFGMFLSLLVAMLAINIYVYCDKVRVKSVEETKFEYMYTYKYPDEKVPEGGYEALAENMKKDFSAYTFDVTVLGITEENPFFGIRSLPHGKKEVIAGSGFASKYQLQRGDEFTLQSEDGDLAYAFTVADIVPFSSSSFVFMDIDECRELFGAADDYFNVVFSDRALEIESGRLYQTLTKKDVEKSADVFIELMTGMIVMMSVASAVIFVVVMYLMMKMMLDKSAFHIALVRIFGFRDKEVRKMYLDGNFYIIAIGALISIPVCKGILNYVYPNFLVANIAVSYENSFPWYIYAGLFVVIFVLYFIISHTLTGRIRKMVPAEVLKNRE
ncbi:MAG: FtsX-like permease family protein, partial [Lachnospiraceae bacterium]|nr:FtsX-like permease family protein [Lachnospiraceae bacterium]